MSARGVLPIQFPGCTSSLTEKRIQAGLLADISVDCGMFGQWTRATRLEQIQLTLFWNRSKSKLPLWHRNEPVIAVTPAGLHYTCRRTRGHRSDGVRPLHFGGLRSRDGIN